MRKKNVFPMKNWRVWFEQVNQTYFDVRARTEGNAIDKARKEWRSEYGHPDVSDIVEIHDKGKP